MKDSTMDELFAEVESVREEAGLYLQRQHRSIETRFCIWEGKSLDGRKHAKDLGKEPFPWENASDTEVRLTDMLINENVKQLKAAFLRAKHSKPQEGMKAGDAEWAGKVSTIVKWLLFTQMEAELRREVEFVGQWQETHGASVMGVFWHEDLGTELKEISVAALEEMVRAQVDEEGLLTPEGQIFQNFLSALFSDEAGAETEAVNMVTQWAPELSRKVARRLVRDLKRDGVAEYPSPYVVSARPKWRAFKVFDDIFFPSATETLGERHPRFIATREWMSEERLKERALTEDWDEDWVEKVLETKGSSAIEHYSNTYFNRLGRATFDHSVEDFRDLIEVWRVYRIRNDERGVPGVYTAVLHPMVSDMLGREEELLNYAHGEYPFVEFRREHVERSILESRGVPEIVRTAQAEIKVQRDSRVDYTSIATLPPAEAPLSRSKDNVRFGPGVVNYSRSAGQLKFLQIPREPQASVEIENATRRDVDEYFGRMTANVHEARALLFNQDIVDDFLMNMRRCLRHTVALLRQFMPADEAELIAGPLPRPWHASHLELQGQYDLKLSFDVRDLDPKHAQAKMELIKNVILPGDVAGVVDRAGITRWQMYEVDPHLADEVVRPMDAVTQEEIEDEQNQLSKIWSGVEPPMKEAGQNPQLRLQVLQQQLQANPQWGQRYEQDELFRALVDTRMQHFQFLLQQEVNKQIGRVGAQQVLGG